MSDLEKYIEAATRPNTRRSYGSDLEHFEVTWGGFLPATADSVARYLATYAETLSLGTLKHRLAALAKWHFDQGFPDPTKAPVVRDVLKGIGELHPEAQEQVNPLQVEQLEQVVFWLESQQTQALESDNRQAILKLSRDKALLLIGFWRAFRSDELCRLLVERITVYPGHGMEILVPRSKGDRHSKGRKYKAPALKRLCPVAAYQDWTHNAGLTEGPVFRSIDRWSNVAETALHVDSVASILRSLFKAADLPDAESLSSRSLRRGFASWANNNQWDVKTLMGYVGWKDVKSAMRYIDAPDPFSQQRIESGLENQSPSSTPPAKQL